MKSFNFKEKITKGKNVYILAGVSFCLVAVAIGIVYSQTMNTLEKNLAPLSTTKQVNVNQQGVTDPRKVTRITTSPSSTSENESSTKTATETSTSAVTTDVQTERITETSTDAVSASTNQSFMMPHDGKIIKNFSPEIPLYCETMNDWRTHSGIDIAVKEGDEVLSVGNGKVTKVLTDSSFGYTVEVDYGSFIARYCGMKQGNCVGINDILSKGDSIGVIDTVPCESKSEPHLHFEVLVEGKIENPLKVIV